MAYGGYGSGPLDTAYGNLDQLGSLAGLFGAGGPGGGAGLHGGKVSTASALAAAGAAEHGQAGSTLGDMPHDDNASYMAADDLQEDQGEPLGQQETEGEPGAGGEVGHGEGQQQQEEAPPPPMTQTIAMGIQDMDAQLANIESKVGHTFGLCCVLLVCLISCGIAGVQDGACRQTAAAFCCMQASSTVGCL